MGLSSSRLLIAEIDGADDRAIGSVDDRVVRGRVTQHMNAAIERVKEQPVWTAIDVDGLDHRERLGVEHCHGLAARKPVPRLRVHRRSTRIRNCSPWLKTALVQCAHSAARTKGSYLQALFHRIRSRRGVNKAIVAVAASILTAIYHMLKDGTMYQDLGPNHFDYRAKERQKNRLIKRLADLGYAVELAPLPH